MVMHDALVTLLVGVGILLVGLLLLGCVSFLTLIVSLLSLAQL